MPSTKDLVIRKITPGEKPPYHLLLLADESLTAIEKYLPHSEIYLAELNNELIGSYVLHKENNSVFEIKNMAVSPCFQNKGVGTQLLSHAIQKAREQRASKLLIGTGNSGFMQLYLYQKAGFRISEIRKNFFIDHYPEPIIENKLRLVDMIVLSMDL
jgi:ribosomal protein S18 acetylase RimI-like enzyme